ncbi:hypothetical protein [Nonomuraea longicatena]|uniref:Uncharacterized protein n=1 Tax=Nonomuraea longicatena TaxID=83682 RepID=A0ABP4A4H1_9ACTN
MSDGHPTAAQREPLWLICDHDRLTASELARHLVPARPASPRYGLAIARQAVKTQRHITDTGGGWTTTGSGRDLIGCSGGPA